jgi:hypothetical protein
LQSEAEDEDASAADEAGVEVEVEVALEAALELRGQTSVMVSERQMSRLPPDLLISCRS